MLAAAIPAPLLVWKEVVAPWAMEMARHPDPSQIPQIDTIQAHFAEILRGQPSSRLIGLGLGTTSLREFPRFLLRLEGTPHAEILAASLSAVTKRSLRYHAALYRKAVGSWGVGFDSEADTEAVHSALFFDFADHSQIFTPPFVIPVEREKGLPGSEWQRFVEAAFEEGISFRMKNLRTGRTVIFRPGHNTLADLMMLGVQKGDRLEIAFRLSEKPDCMSGIQRLQNAVVRVLTGNLSAWEENESAVKIVERRIDRVAHAPLDPREIASICRDLQQARHAVVRLEVDRQPSQVLTLRSGEPERNREKLAALGLVPGRSLTIRVVAAAASYLCDRLLSLFLRRPSEEGGLAERALRYTVSRPETTTLPLELRERYVDRNQRQEMAALIRLDRPEEILLFPGDGKVSTEEMKELWGLSLGKTAVPIAEARLFLETKQFRISRANGGGLNTTLSDSELERARNILLFHLLARGMECRIPPNASFDGPIGYVIHIEPQSVDPSLPHPLPSEETVRRLQVLLFHHDRQSERELTPIPPPAEAPGPGDPASTRQPWRTTGEMGDLLWTHLRQLAVRNDPALEFVQGDLEDIWLAAGDLHPDIATIPVVFSPQNQWMLLGKYPAFQAGALVPVFYRQWTKLIAVAERYQRDRHGMLWCEVGWEKNLWRVTLRFKTLDRQPMGPDERQEATRAMGRFLKRQGISFRVASSGLDSVLFLEVPSRWSWLGGWIRRIWEAVGKRW